MMAANRFPWITAALAIALSWCVGCGSVDSEFDGPLTAFRLNPSGGAKSGNHLHGYRILQTVSVQDEGFAARIRAILDDDDSYGGPMVKCFDPGMGFRFGEGESQVDVVICLACNWAYVFKDGQVDERVLSDEGVRRLTEVYRELFPNGADDGA